MPSILRPSLLRQKCSLNHWVVGSQATSSRSSRLYNVAFPATQSILTPRLRAPPSSNDNSAHQRVSKFHHTAYKAILPAGPQVIDGTANDPARVPEPSPTHGSYHWTFERLVSVALIPLTIAPFAAGSLNPVMDAILCSTILIHSHIGFESIVIDYLPKWRIPKTRALFWWGLRAGTVLVGVGLYEFETNDVGVTEAIKRIWKA